MQHLNRVIRYSNVGILAASVHMSVQLIMGIITPLWISNSSGFLVASIVSYLGHSLYTYRKETLGKIFSKRWLVIQFSVNMILSSILPFPMIALFGTSFITRTILVLFPILINAFIWKKAANFSVEGS